MKKEQLKKDMEKMFFELTDPVKREEARRKTDIKNMLSNKRKDTGII